jgi:hypothetical protein
LDPVGGGAFVDFEDGTVHRKERSIRRAVGIRGQVLSPCYRLLQVQDRLKEVSTQESGRCIGLFSDLERGRPIRGGLTGEVAGESAQQAAE